MLPRGKAMALRLIDGAKRRVILSVSMTTTLAGRARALTGTTLKWFLVAACAFFAASPTHGRVKKIQITAKESPTFGGYSWPGVGQYEKIVGKAFGEIDPKDAKNAVIIDLQLA